MTAWCWDSCRNHCGLATGISHWWWGSDWIQSENEDDWTDTRVWVGGRVWVEEVTAYLERVQMLLVAKASRRTGKFLCSCWWSMGRPTCTLLSGLLAPGKPKDKSFEDFSDVLQKHFEPNLWWLYKGSIFIGRTRLMGSLWLTMLHSCTA